MVTAQQKSEQIQGKVGQLIGWLKEEASRPGRPLGSSFPANQEIVKKFNVSLSTAHKALKTLVESGYLSSKPGSGYVLIKKPEITSSASHMRSSMPQVGSMMAVISTQAEHGKVLDTYLHYIYEQCDKAELQLRLVRNRPEELEEALYVNNIKGILLLNGHEKTSIDLPEYIPTVSFGYSEFHQESSVMTIDMEDGSFQAFRHLCGLGHTKIAIVSSCVEGWKKIGFSEFILGMRKACKDYGMEWTPQCVVDLDAADIPRDIQLLEYLKKRGITGIFCPRWDDVMRLYREAQGSSIKIGRDISVIAYGNHDHLDMFHPSITRIGWDPREVIDKAFKILSLGQPQKITEKVSVRLVSGESTSLLTS